MSTKKNESPANLCVIDARAFYLHIYEPTKAAGAAKAKYNGQFAWPKTDKATTAIVVSAFNAALKIGKEKGHIPQTAIFKPTEIIKDGDKPTENGTSRGKEYEGMWYVSAKSDNIPGIAFLNDQKIMVESVSTKDVQSGDYVKVQISVYAFPSDKEKGISCGIAVALNNVLRVKIGQRLAGGGQDLKTAFSEFVGSDEDDLGLDDFDLEDDDDDLAF